MYELALEKSSKFVKRAASLTQFEMFAKTQLVCLHKFQKYAEYTFHR